MPTLDQIQDRAIDAIMAAAYSGAPSSLLEMPCGTGKTHAAGKFVHAATGLWGGATLFLAHRQELIEQTEAEFARMGIACAVEMADRHAPRSPAASGLDCVVASKDTLQRSRLASWPRDAFKRVISDEAHLATAKTFGNIYEHFRPDFHLGLSATPYRMDGARLIPDVFARKAFRYSLKEAISNGHLAPIRGWTCRTMIDLRGLRISRTTGDYAPGELETRIAGKVVDMANAIRQEVELFGLRKAICFAPDVGSAAELAKALNGVGIVARSVHGGNDAYPMTDAERQSVIRQFRQGDVTVLVNCELCTTGFNQPDIDAAFMCRPTRSLSLFHQMTGRCLRNAPGKPFANVVGFAWQSDDDDGLVSTVDLFLDESADVPTRRLARKLARMTPPGEPKAPDLEAIARQAEEIREREIEREQRESERRLRIEARKKDLKYRRDEWSPFGGARFLGEPQVTSALPASRPPTRAQAELLASYGMDPQLVAGLNEQSADQIARMYLDRDLRGLATPKQVAWMLKNHVPPERAMAMTRREASGLMAERLSGFRKRA